MAASRRRYGSRIAPPDAWSYHTSGCRYDLVGHGTVEPLKWPNHPHTCRLPPSTGFFRTTVTFTRPRFPVTSNTRFDASDRR